MDTVESLHKYLDDNPADAAARCALGDLLTELGDPRGPGIAALGRLGKWPYRTVDCSAWSFALISWAGTCRPEPTWGWEDGAGTYLVFPCWVIPSRWAGQYRNIDSWAPFYKTRRAAEDWAADLYTKLPQSSRDLILAGDLVYRD